MDADPILELLFSVTVALLSLVAGWTVAGRAGRRRGVFAGIGFSLAAWLILTSILPDRFYLIYPAFPFGRSLFGSAFFLPGVLARVYADTSLRRILQGVLAAALLYFVLAEPLWFAASADEIKRLDGRARDGVTIQSTYYTCVPSALATVLRTWGVEATEGELSYRMRTSFQGTSPNQVPAVAEHFGRGRRVTARIVDTTLDELMRHDRPAILVGKTGSVRHAVALIGLDERRVTLGDPLRGRISVERAALAREFEWNGLAILIDSHPGDLRAPTLRAGHATK